MAARVTAVAKGSVTAGGELHSCDLVAGADGAGRLVRRTFLSPTPPARLTMAAGWFAPGAAPMLVRFAPGELVLRPLRPLDRDVLRADDLTTDIAFVRARLS